LKNSTLFNDVIISLVFLRCSC